MKRVMVLKAVDDEKEVRVTVDVKTTNTVLTKDEFEHRANGVFDLVAQSLQTIFHFRNIKNIEK